MTPKECPYPNSCPSLAGQKPEVVRAKINYLETRVDELEAACNLATQVIQQKDTEIVGLQEEITELKAVATEERAEIYKPTRRNPKGGTSRRTGGPPGKDPK